MLIIELASDQLEVLEHRVDQVELADVIQEEGKIVVTQVQ